MVIGGGIAGLSAAWELSGGANGPNDATPRIELIEDRDVVGGSLATGEFAGRTIDLGADGFLARRPKPSSSHENWDATINSSQSTRAARRSGYVGRSMNCPPDSCSEYPLHQVN